MHSGITSPQSGQELHWITQKFPSAFCLAARLENQWDESPRQTLNCEMQIVSAALSRAVCLHGCRLRCCWGESYQTERSGAPERSRLDAACPHCLSITFVRLAVWLSSALPLLRVQPFPFSSCCVLPLLGFPSIFVTLSSCKPRKNKPLPSAHICRFSSQSLVLLALNP